MASSSSSNSFGVVSLAVMLPFLLISASASTEFIDVICQHVTDKTFCIQTLNTYPPAASAADEFQAATETLRLAISHAEKSAAFARKAAKKNPNLKKQFKASHDAFMTIINSLNSAVSELMDTPDTANYDVMVCSDSTTIVKNLIGENTDRASKKIITMTLMMDKLRAIAIGATEAVGG